MKHNVLVIFVLLIAALCAMPRAIMAQVTVGDFKYTFSGGEATITGCVSTPENGIVTIPSSVNYNNAVYSVVALGRAFYFNSKIVKVVIPETIKTIGENCFASCDSLTTVEMSNSVTTLGANCFANSQNLSSVKLSESLSNLPYGCFSFCLSLSSIEIPQSVTSIDAQCFYYCQSLTSISIPKSVTTLGDDCFLDCRILREIHVSWDQPLDYTFDANNLQSACVYVPKGLVDVYKSNTTWNKYKAILEEGSPSRFANVDGLDYYFENGEATVATQNILTTLEHVVIPSTVTYEGVSYPVTSVDNTAFISRGDIRSIKFPASITSLNGCCKSCSFLSSVDIPNTLTSFGPSCFTNTMLSSIYIPEGVTTIDASCFRNCKLLEHIDLNQNIKKIGDYAFYNCAKLTSLDLPSSVDSIGAYAFSFCSALDTVCVHSETPSVLKNDAVFTHSPFSFLFVPKGAKQAYQANPEWSVFTLILEGNPQDAVIQKTTLNGIVYYINNDEATVAKQNTSAIKGEITIPVSVSFEGNAYPVKSLANFCFYNCGELTKLYIPNSVTYYGNYAFAYCEQLSEVTNSNQIESFGNSCFAGCRKLVSVNMPESLTSISKSCFTGCHKLPSIVIPSGVTSIGADAFSSCNMPTSIDIPASVTHIGSNAFASDSSLTNVTVHWNTPISCAPDAFGSKSYKNLYVPGQTKSAYASIEPWNLFVTSLIRWMA